jgi:hypothetical protein
VGDSTLWELFGVSDLTTQLRIEGPRTHRLGLLMAVKARLKTCLPWQVQQLLVTALIPIESPLMSPRGGE